MCVGVWLKSPFASVVCIITSKAVTRAGEAGFSIHFLFFPLMEKSISPTLVTILKQLFRRRDRKWSSIPLVHHLFMHSSLSLFIKAFLNVFHSPRVPNSDSFLQHWTLFLSSVGVKQIKTIWENSFYKRLQPAFLQLTASLPSLILSFSPMWGRKLPSSSWS